MNRIALLTIAAFCLVFAALLAGCGGNGGQSDNSPAQLAASAANPAESNATAPSAASSSAPSSSSSSASPAATVPPKGEPLPVGMQAPDFKAQDEKGNLVALADFRGKKNVVLVFYPKDNSSVCTSQLCAIRDDWSKFQEKDVLVFGVNPGGAESHLKFIEKNQYPFPILVDEERSIAKSYYCDGALFISRTVYGIDKTGRIVFAQRGKPDPGTVLKAF